MTNPAIDYKIIGNRIKIRRQEMNMTQEKLAELINASVYTLSRIENGHSTTLETLAEISFHLQTDLTFLIAGTSTKEKSYFVSQLNDLCSKASNDELTLIIKVTKAIIDK